MTATYEDVRAARRRLEERIRADLADMERNGTDPEEILMAIAATLEFWRDEIEDL